jgi:hypothetical protein
LYVTTLGFTHQGQSLIKLCLFAMAKLQPCAYCLFVVVIWTLLVSLVKSFVLCRTYYFNSGVESRSVAHSPPRQQQVSMPRAIGTSFWIAFMANSGSNNDDTTAQNEANESPSTLTTTTLLANEEDEAARYDTSTLTLLEHINLNVPQHDFCLPFYINILGCGLDPRKAANVHASKTIWVNGGASQFHLPHNATVAQRIPGRMGVRVRRWSDFVQRVQEQQAEMGNSDNCLQAVEMGHDQWNQPFIQLTDHYHNVFYCRPYDEPSLLMSQRPFYAWRQPVIARADEIAWGVTAKQYGLTRPETGCAGIDFCEFHCPPGTAARIALFYDSVLDATVSVVPSSSSADKDLVAAVIAIGTVDTVTGRADQALIFRETTDPIPPYDGHHIALYVGSSAADFDQAYRNCELAGIVWVNPRFSDKATTLPLARQFQQFRFKDIVDMETGHVIMELEHEMRSIEHEAFPGHNVNNRNEA